MTADPAGALSATANPVLVELWRGAVLECVHRGAAAIVGPDGEIVEEIGDAGRVILPRSAAKMIQALPLVESGAADAARLGTERLALACASHSGAPMHVERVTAWLADIGLGEEALRCGAHAPLDPAARRALRAAGDPNTQIHNNCSGKHTGFLTLGRHLGAGPEYIALDHPVQRSVREAVAETCGEEPAGYAIDGCSAPNFAVSLAGLARAMAGFARPAERFSGLRRTAAARLRDAMAAHPALIAGEERANTRLMRAASVPLTLKSGAEGVFVAILPGPGFGIAVKIDDGSDAAAQAAIAALLVRHGALDAAHPTVRGTLTQPLINARGTEHGQRRVATALLTP
ncbi:MAG: asparaginase [Pseudomonadota bacterium]